jgi:hypothetical protein
MTISIKYFVVMTVMAMTSVVCHAQLGQSAPLPQVAKPTGPTLEATQEWLTTKLRELSFETPLEKGKDDVRHIILFDGCDARFVRMARRGTSPTPDRLLLWVSAVSLADLDPDKPTYTLGRREVVRFWNSLSGPDTWGPRFWDGAISSRAFSGDMAAIDQIANNLMNDRSEESKAYILGASFQERHVSQPGLNDRLNNALAHAATLCATQETEMRKAKTEKRPDEPF